MKHTLKIFACLAVILLLSFTTHKIYFYSWSGLASTTWITKGDVTDGIANGYLTAHGSAPGISDNTWITRDQLKSWVMLSSTGSRSANDWMTKSDITIANLYNIPIKGYDGSGTGWSGNGFSNSSDALTYGSASTNVWNGYWTASSLSTGMDIYTLNSGIYSTTYWSTIQYSWWYVPSTGCAVQLQGINTSGSYYGSPYRIADISCGYTVNWSWDNSHNIGNRSLSIYKNGSLIVSETMGSNSSSFNIIPGDNIQIVLTCSGFSVYCQQVDVAGGASYSNSNCVDATIDSGSLSPSGNVFISASVYN